MALRQFFSLTQFVGYQILFPGYNSIGKVICYLYIAVKIQLTASFMVDESFSEIPVLTNGCII